MRFRDIRVRPYQSPSFYPTASIQGSPNAILRRKDAILAGQHGYGVDYGDDVLGYDDQDEDRSPSETLDRMFVTDEFDFDLDEDGLDEASIGGSYGADPVQRAIFAAEAAEAAAKVAVSAARKTKKMQAASPFRSIAAFFRKPHKGVPSKAERVLAATRKVEARPPSPPPQPPVVVKQGTSTGAVVGIAVGALLLGGLAGWALGNRG